MNCVYILHSVKLDRFYIGFTSDFDIRMEFHKNAKSNKFTANANDWEFFRINTKTCGAVKIKHKYGSTRKPVEQ